jgi:hypothetical protein
LVIQNRRSNENWRESTESDNYVLNTDDDSLEVSEVSELSDESTETEKIFDPQPSKRNNMFRFDSSMYDTRGHTIILKVNSHQLKEDFSGKVPGMPQAQTYLQYQQIRLCEHTARSTLEGT